jgi:cardiolipin synthase
MDQAGVPPRPHGSGPALDPQAGGTAPSSAIVTVPNVISLGRLGLMPACAGLLAAGHYSWGLALAAALAASDGVDGWLARRTDQVSRLGQLLDPLADQVLLASIALVLLVRGVLPWPALALLVGRDLILLAGWVLLRRRGVQPPEVVGAGKAATVTLLGALLLLIWGEIEMTAAPAAHVLGVLALWLGVVLHYVAGGIYVKKAADGLAQHGRSTP